MISGANNNYYNIARSKIIIIICSSKIVLIVIPNCQSINSISIILFSGAAATFRWGKGGGNSCNYPALPHINIESNWWRERSVCRSSRGFVTCKRLSMGMVVMPCWRTLCTVREHIIIIREEIQKIKIKKTENPQSSSPHTPGFS